MKLCLLLMALSHVVMSTQAQIPDQGLYFTLNGSVYLPGHSVLITDIGAFTAQTQEGAASSLVCVTSNVNTLCCRTSDGGNVGEWFFPNGTIVPRNSGNSYSDFTRSGFTHQVRLNHRNDALMPTGQYSCRVPDETDSTLIHNAIIKIISIEISVPAQLRIAENHTTVHVCASLSVDPATAVTNRAINISLGTINGTAISGSDYVPASMEFTFPINTTNNTMECLDISILDDMIALEREEAFLMALTTSDTVSLQVTETTIIIMDNEHVTISTPVTTSVAEDDGRLRVCATLYGELEILQNDLTMKLVTSLTSSATENFDYIGISTVLVIPEGSSNGTVHCLDINIIDDDMLEGDETFNILWTTSEARVELINNITTIIIRDDEDADECFTRANPPTCTVATPIVSIFVSPGPLVAGRERDVTLNCSARLNLTVLTRGRIGYDFQWEDGNNGTVVETGERTTITTAPSIPSVISYSVLTLSPLSIVDTNFTCTVMVMEMQGALRDSDLGAANLLLNVTTPNDPVVDIVSNGSVAGTTITLTCTVSLPQPLREVPSIVWIAPDGTEIGNGTILDVETCSLTPYIETLTFSPLHTDYGGEYTCSAGVNIEEAGVSIANSSSVTITVQIPPPTVNITGSPVDSDFFSGLQLILTCSIHIPQQLQSMPWTVLAHWTKAGSRIISNSRITVEEGITRVESLLYQSTLAFTSLDGGRGDEGEYTCSGRINSSLSTSAYTIEIHTIVFQMEILGIANCRSWRLDHPSEKDHDLVEAVVENILPHCGCDFREDRITDRVFQCFPSSPQSVTYHAQLHGTLNANASELIRDIEDWVSTGVTVSIQLLPLIVSSVCAVSPHAPIQQCQAQLGTPEDNILDETSSQTSSPEVTFNSIPVTASATVLVIIVVAITAITVIVIVHLRNRHSVINSKTTNNTSSNRPTPPSSGQIEDITLPQGDQDIGDKDTQVTKMGGTSENYTLMNCPAYINQSQEDGPHDTNTSATYDYAVIPIQKTEHDVYQ